MEVNSGHLRTETAERSPKTASPLFHTANKHSTDTIHDASTDTFMVEVSYVLFAVVSKRSLVESISTPIRLHGGFQSRVLSTPLYSHRERPARSPSLSNAAFTPKNIPNMILPNQAVRHDAPTHQPTPSHHAAERTEVAHS